MSNPATSTLIVDLDETLIRSDLLHESFWNSFSRYWLSPIWALAALTRGKAALKSYLKSKSEIDFSSLPYDPKVIDYIKKHKKQGGHTALVTASNQVFAKKIADHLQIFDEVHGSHDYNNLKGPAKAAFLIERFGEGKFSYMGDAATDLHIWEVSSKVITVNASSSLRKKVENLGKPVEHLVTRVTTSTAYIKALRPHQWLKNILIFLPMLAAHQIDATTAFTSGVAFIAFSLMASTVYVMNDLLDLTSDREHPRKRLRPFACGAIPIAHGSLLMLGLLGASILITLFLSWKLLTILIAYFVLSSAYSLFLKRQIILDICVLALLYTSRILAGSAATAIEPSVWLLAFSTFIFFSLAAMKRQAELVDMAKRGALIAKGRGYHVDDVLIISMMGLAAGYVSVLVLALYLNTPSVVGLYKFPPALWGICGVMLYWLTRMALITHRGLMDDDPIVFAAKDKISKLCFILILAFVMIGISL